MIKPIYIALFLLCLAKVYLAAGAATGESPLPKPDFVLTKDQNHTKFSRAIPPVARVPSGCVIEADIHDATGGQFHLDSTIEDLKNLDMDRIHTLTGPIYVEEAEVGDVLAVELLDLEAGDWGWTGTWPWPGGFLFGWGGQKVDSHSVGGLFRGLMVVIIRRT